MLRKTLLFVAFVSSFSIAYTQNVGVGTSSPGTKLDVNGAFTVRETAVTVSANAATVPNNVSQVQLIGSATATITLTAPSAPPNAGQVLFIYNNTAGGYGATFGSSTIANGSAQQFIYSNSAWIPTSSTGGGGSVTADDGLNVNMGSNVELGGTLTKATTITQGTYTLTHSLTGTGDLSIQENGNPALYILGKHTAATDGYVGIGTASPAMALDVTSATTTASSAAIRGQTSATTANLIYGVQGISTSTAANAAGVYGVNNAAGAVVGVEGSSSASSGSGVYGYASNTTGASVGVFGEATSSNASSFAIAGQADVAGGSAIFGINNGTAGTGSGYGVAGYTSQASTNAAGVEGLNLNNAGVGVLGVNGGSTPVTVGGFGVTGSAINSASGHGGVIGTITSTTTVQAQGALGYRSGATYYGVASISGTKSAIVPIGPHEHRAVYCLESAENYFEDMGEAKLVNGRATVNIDPTFLKTVTIDSAHQMMVLITLLDEVPNQVYVKRDTTSFEVIESNHGTTNASFTYRIAGHRKGYENMRLGVFEESDWESLQVQPQGQHLQIRGAQK